MLNISHGEVSITKRSKICGLYIFLEGSNVVVYSSSAREEFHDMNNLYGILHHNMWIPRGYFIVY